ncbi:MAG: hypothetical protein IKZ86_05920 [Spirochaetaceae bacterium]|nr:hypothetical protein [Spirochaetaceae bacterium]
MKLQYLCSDENDIEKIRKKYQSDVAVTLLDGTLTSIVEFSKKEDDEDTAKELSSIDTDIRNGDFCLQLIENDASAFFNKKLYPLFNTFERDLRKVLYLAKAIIGDEGNDNQNLAKEVSHKINKLEFLDFGKLYTLLFTSENFYKCFSEDFEKLKSDSPYNKKQLEKLISDIPEYTLWEKLLYTKEVAPNTTEQFFEIKEYRNDVMHAHNIDYDTYQKIKELMTKVNGELANLNQKYNPTLTPEILNDKQKFIQLNSTIAETLVKLSNEFWNNPHFEISNSCSAGDKPAYYQDFENYN